MMFRRLRLRWAEENLARAADDLNHMETFAWAHSREYVDLKRSRLAARKERAAAKVERLRREADHD